MSDQESQRFDFMLNASATHDYYSVHSPPKTKRGFSSQLCTVFARNAKHALTVARNHGLRVKGATASHLGLAGYTQSLARCGGGVSVS